MSISFVRTVILYILVIAAVRFMGKRQIGELQPSELVVTILISELAAIPMQETGIPLTSGIIPILTLISCEIVLSTVTLLSNKARRLITGRPSVLINNGRINQVEMRKLRFTIDDLLEEIRMKGYKNVDEVAYAVIETNGKLSIFPNCDNTPVTAGMLKLTCPDGGLPYTVISDGCVIEAALRNAGKSMEWLDGQLNLMNLRPKDVFLMTVDGLDKTIIIPKDTDSHAKN